MKTRLILLMWLLGAGWLAAQPTEYPGTFDQMKADAQATGKPMALYFYSSNLCTPCKKLETETLNTNSIASVLNQDFLYMSLNGQSLEREGFQMASKFRITLYPTIILFNPDGSVAKNVSGMQTPSMLLPDLRALAPAEAPVAVATPTQPSPNSSNPAATPTSGPAPARPSSMPATRAKAPVHTGWWQIDVDPLPSRGYGVQVGVFSNYQTITEEVNRLSPHYNFPMAIRPEVLNGQTVFKLVFGPFPTQAAARDFETKYERAEGKSAYVLDMGE